MDEKEFSEQFSEVALENPFLEYPDWLILSSFDKMNKSQKERCKDRYAQLMKEKRQFNENTFTDLINSSNTVEVSNNNQCKNPYCINGKLLKDDEFLGYCHCIKKEQHQELVEKSNMPSNLKSKKVSNFRVVDSQNIVDKELKNIKDKIHDKFKDFDFGTSDPFSCLFLGKPLRGKTHLASAIANLYLNNDVSVRYINYENFMSEIKQNYKDTIFQDKIFKTLSTVDVLFIDDLFSVKVSDSDVSFIYRVLNERVNNKLPVLITSRVMYNDFSKLYPSVFGRLYELVQKDNIFIFEEDIQLNF